MANEDHQVSKHLRQFALPKVAAAIASAILLGCGGGGGGEAASSGSQSVVPSGSTTTAASASAPASTASAAASAPADGVSKVAQATETAASAASQPSATASASASGSTIAGANTAQGGSMTTAPQQGGSSTSNSTVGSAAGSAQQTPSPSNPDKPAETLASGASSSQAQATAEGANSSTQATNVINLDRLKTAIADMTLPNEIFPAGVANAGWKFNAQVVMGTEPYGSAIPSWWKGNRYESWRSVVTWFVIYPGEGGNPAANSAVEVNGLELWYLSAKDRVWRRLQSAAAPAWSGAYAQNAIDTSSEKTYAKVTSTAALLAPGANNMVHGGLLQVAVPWNATTDKSDIDALYAAVRHRLVLKNSNEADDRSKARLVVQVGVDYYPWVGAKVADLAPANYVPSAGSGRFIPSTTNWKYSTLLLRSKRITEAQLLAIAPPSLTF